MHPPQISVVAILKGEEDFVEEWIAYHRIMGVAHFFLYDNHPDTPLSKLPAAYSKFVTVIPWSEPQPHINGRNIQVKAYMDSLGRIQTKWVTFIDGDEFIVINRHSDLSNFLSNFADAGAVLLAWRLFGHCGFFSTPPGLITASLLRRRAAPSRQFKAITQVAAIDSIESVHSCVLKAGWATFDADHQEFSPERVPLVSNAAHINHYMCRSFESWMERASRGCTHFNENNCPPEARWRLDAEGCLRQFVSITKDWNEQVDETMLKYTNSIEAFIHRMRNGDRPLDLGSILPPRLLASVGVKEH